MRAALRLLVVDDEPLVRDSLVRALEDRGFSTDEAADGLIASELIRTSPRPFDLLITDIAMPRMSGLDLAELTATVSPSTKILLISADIPTTRQGLHLPYLQKPFDLDLFLNTVRQLLNSWTPPKSFPTVD